MIVPGRASRMVTVEIEVETSVVGARGEEVIERVRFADGRWRKPGLWVQRLAALGVTVDFRTTKFVREGRHTPSY